MKKHIGAQCQVPPVMVDSCNKDDFNITLAEQSLKPDYSDLIGQTKNIEISTLSCQSALCIKVNRQDRSKPIQTIFDNNIAFMNIEKLVRKLYSLIYFIIMIIPTCLHGQEDNTLKLVDLLNNGEYFESREWHQKMCDTISPDIELYYKFKMAQFVNKKDSAVIYLEKILKEYPDLFGNETIDIHEVLFDSYINLGNIDKALYTHERIIQQLKENKYNIDKDRLLQLEKYTEYLLCKLKSLINKPKIRIKRKNTNDSVRILGELRPQIIAHFNQLALKTVLDTGAEQFCVMDKNTADRIGVRYDTAALCGKEIINGSIPINKAVVDSIEIGNITLYNIPVEVYESNQHCSFPDSLNINPEEKTTTHSSNACLTTPIIAGLPLMQLIGKLLIDNENKKITFPVYNDSSYISKEPNLFIYNRTLYTHLEINKKEFTAFLNTGAEIFIGIDTAFYEKHKKDIQIDSIIALTPFSITTLHQVQNNIPYMIPYKPKIKFEDSTIPIPRKRFVTIYSLYSMLPFNYFDGIIGYFCLKRLGKKVLFDFDNMRLDVK